MNGFLANVGSYLKNNACFIIVRGKTAWKTGLGENMLSLITNQNDLTIRYVLISLEKIKIRAWSATDSQIFEYCNCI